MTTFTSFRILGCNVLLITLQQNVIWFLSSLCYHHHHHHAVITSYWGDVKQNTVTVKTTDNLHGTLLQCTMKALYHGCKYCKHLQQKTQTFFTARRSYASEVLGVVILSVRHTRALWLIQRTYRRYFYTTWNSNPSSFLHPTVVGGRRPLSPKMGDRSDPPLQKSLTSTDFLL